MWLPGSLHKYEVCLLDTLKTFTLYTQRYIGWRSLVINIFYSALYLKKLLFQIFPPSSHLNGCSRSAIHLSLLKPSHSLSLRFHEIAPHSQKRLRIFRKLSWRSTMTRPWRDRSCKWKWKDEIGETGDDQRNITAMASIADIAAKVENDQGRCHETCSGPWHVHSSQGSAALKKLARWASNCFTRRLRRSDWECARRWPRWLHDHLRQRSHCWWVGWGWGASCHPDPHTGGLLEGVGGGAKNDMAANFAEALQQWNEHCLKCLKIAGGHINKKLKIKNRLSITVFIYWGLKCTK